VITIVGIGGSLRKASWNRALVRAFAALAPENVTVEEATIEGIPLYDGDLEAASGIPPAVTALQDRIAAADGLLLASPEYNAGMPGVFENALDWLTRPPGAAGRVFSGKPTALTGATPGTAGTISAQAEWLPVLRAMGVNLWMGPRLYVSGVNKLFDDEGQLIDEVMRKRASDFIAGFAGYIRLLKSAQH